MARHLSRFKKQPSKKGVTWLCMHPSNYNPRSNKRSVDSVFASGKKVLAAGRQALWDSKPACPVQVKTSLRRLNRDQHRANKH